MTAVGLSAKVNPTAGADAAATAGPQAAGESDAFAQLMALLAPTGETGAEQPADGVAAAPAAGIAAALAAAQAPTDSAVVTVDQTQTEAAPEEPQQAFCMIELADMAAKMLVAGKLPDRTPRQPPMGEDAPEGEGEGDTLPTPETAGDPAPVTGPGPILAMPIATPLPQPVAVPVPGEGDRKESLPAAAAVTAAALPIADATKRTTDKGLPVAKADEQSSVDEQAQASLVAANIEPRAVLPQPLRLALQQILGGGDNPVPVDTGSDTAMDPLSGSDRPLPPPLSAALTGASFQALVQTQPADIAPLAPADQADPGAELASPELAMERHLDIAKDNAWLDGLARDIARSADRDSTLRFQLNPQTLGTLRVEVQQGHAGTSVKLTADTEAARAIIADAQPRLIAEARAQGVRIAEAHVGMELGSQGTSDQRRQSDARQENFVRTAAQAQPATTTEETTRAARGAAERFA